MQLALQPDSTACEHASTTTSAATARRSKMLVAGIAVASAGVLAVTPVATAPAIEESRRAAVEMVAFTNPLSTLQTAFTNTMNNVTTLNANATTSANAVAAALGNPAVQAQFTGILTAATDPQRLLGTIGSLPGYLNSLAAAGNGSSTQFQEAITALPGVLQISAGFLAEGKFLEAFAEVNLWFLTAGLSDLRGSALDAFRVPGDILDSLGLEPLARILGTSWMDTGTAGPGYGRGLLSRGIIGNFGRAVLGAPVTAIFQTVEIMDDIRGALQTGDLETAVSALVNAPIKIVNAFVNGYVPDFVTDPNSPIPPGPGQTFPGLIGPTGTFDFLFRQIPAEIAAALQVPRPAPPAPVAPASAPEATATNVADTSSPSDIPAIEDAALLKVDVTPSVQAPAPDPAPAPIPESAVASTVETGGTPTGSSTANAPAVSTPSNDGDDDDQSTGGTTSGGTTSSGSGSTGGTTGGSTGGTTGGSTGNSTNGTGGGTSGTGGTTGGGNAGGGDSGGGGDD